MLFEQRLNGIDYLHRRMLHIETYKRSSSQN